MNATTNFLTQRDRRPQFYSVTIRHESDFSRNPEGDWVARDEDGNWRAHCAHHFAVTAAESVAMMFHLDEISNVVDDGDRAHATIEC